MKIMKERESERFSAYYGASCGAEQSFNAESDEDIPANNHKLKNGSVCAYLTLESPSQMDKLETEMTKDIH